MTVLGQLSTWNTVRGNNQVTRIDRGITLDMKTRVWNELAISTIHQVDVGARTLWVGGLQHCG